MEILWIGGKFSFVVIFDYDLPDEFTHSPTPFGWLVK